MAKAWDPVWEEIFSRRGWGKYPGEDLVRFVARNFYHVQERGEVKILEVGSGTGANLWFLAREGFPVFGIDGSATGVELTRARLDQEVPGWSGRLEVGDILSLPFQRDEFHGAIDNQAISANSFKNAKRIYSELFRVLRPGGILYTRSFTTETTGFGTGQELGRNAFLPSIGPLQGIGCVRFSSESCMRELLSPFDIVEFDRVSRGYGELDRVSEWSVVARKPS